MLALATLFWGCTFPVVKDAINTMPVFVFLAIRFALAAVAMLPLTGFPRRAAIKTGTWLGVLLFFSFAFQTVGLSYTSAANCAFITGLNIVWLALLGARDRYAWTAVGLAVASLYFLTDPQQGFNLGDALTLICSLFIAAHTIALARLDNRAGSGELATVQFAVVSLLSLVGAFFSEPPLIPTAWDASIIFAFLLTVLGATVFSFWAQTHFQRYTTPLRAGLIFILEPLFATVFAVAFYDEILSESGGFGALLMLAAMVITIKRPPPAVTAH